LAENLVEYPINEALHEMITAARKAPKIKLVANEGREVE
jgi:hypothetical protein